MEKQTRITVVTPTIRGEEALLPVGKGLQNQKFGCEWLTEISDGKKPDLASAYNRLLKRARGELIVFIQDFIEIAPGALQKLWDAYQESPDTFFTCPVEHQLQDGTAWDWRKNREEINWIEWEIDFGAAPLAALKKIGGFDEWMDEQGVWGFDNVNLALRANLAGYKFKCLKNATALGFFHPPTELQRFRNPELHNSRLDEFRHGLKVNYLV